MDIQIYLMQVSLVVAASLSLVAIDEPTKTPVPPKVECHLDVAERSGAAPGDFGGEFTLKNTSAEPLKIEYNCHPTTLLDLDVKDEKGKTLPKCLEAYGYIYSPVHPGPDVLTIEPGETYRTHVRAPHGWTAEAPGTSPTRRRASGARSRAAASAGRDAAATRAVRRRSSIL